MLKCDYNCILPRAPIGFGDTFAPGDALALSESFLPEDAGVDRAELGLKGSFFTDPSIPFSRGDRFPFPFVCPSFESSTTRS